MPSTVQLRSRLVTKLKELFQLDQPDLDFGFYRIMHAKARQVSEFLEKDLLQVIEDTFGNQADQQSTATLANARRELEESLGADALDESGALKDAFAGLPAGKRYLEALAKAVVAKDALSAEGEIYDHLHRFFERYYEDGDFISRRYFSRETAGRAAPFAIPYNGEEVKLHWANADQYYIKTGEYFSNFTVDLAKAPEAAGEMKLESADSLPVHFRVVDAVEGEHGNVKASDATKRFFILHAEDPVGFNDNGELELRFEYRPDPDKPEKSQEGKWQEELRSQACEKILETLATLPEAAAWHRLLAAKAPTDANKDRNLLAKYLYQYTARNTSDYFIHKDLGSFLRRELDFYIKNEVMRLDDIENEDAPRVESYLAKLKVLRNIARQLIDFLAQLENFQKKLWLKKKFVTETNYGITLDRVPEELYPEIAASESQREEWVKIYAIDEIEGEASGDLLQSATPGYSSPLTVEFLKYQPFLVLDTRHFSEKFKSNLVASIENFDEQCNGLLLHSENFQGLRLLRGTIYKQLKQCYIDPPYNTSSTPILYKNDYKHAAWLSLIQDRIRISFDSLIDDGVHTIAIDDTEVVRLSALLEDQYPDFRLTRVAVVHNPKGSITKDFNRVHEYALFLTRESSKSAICRTIEENETPRKMRRWGENSRRKDRRPSFYPIYVKDKKIVSIGIVPPDEFHPKGKNVLTSAGEIEIWPIDQEGIERRWNFGLDSIRDNLNRIIVQESDGNLDLFVSHEMTVPKTVWTGGEFDAGSYGNTLLINILGEKRFDFPKSIYMMKRCLSLAMQDDKFSKVLDYFGGSGSTGHAVISLNREDYGHRKYILIEMGDHFDTVIKPRMAKVVYSPDWKDGKPVTRDKGISHCFKYIRLESYEDTLNNLRFVENKTRDEALKLNEPLRRDYTLNYLLDVETRGSQSLLNIDAFTDPAAYTLKVKKSGATGSVEQAVDLIETFNFLIGLRVIHLAAPQRFAATFKRVPDPDLPKGTDTRLQLDGKMKQSADGAWWFRKVEGWVPKDRENPNNGQKETILIVWRTLTGNLEEDNLMLDEWFQKNRLSTRDFEFDTIYVNGSNNLPNLKLDTDTWKVRLLEEEFHKAMWDVQDI